MLPRLGRCLTVSLSVSLSSRLIESSLGSMATKFNFFIHNLAQLRFSGLPASDEPILSFSPRTHSLKQDGRVLQASIFSFQKRYSPDKHYVSLLTLTTCPTSPGLTQYLYMHSLI